MSVEKAKVLLCDYSEKKLVNYNEEGVLQKFPIASGIAGVVIAKKEFENNFMASASFGLVNNNFTSFFIAADSSKFPKIFAFLE